MFISVVLTLWIGPAVYGLIYSLTVRTLNLEGVVRGLFAAGPVVFGVISENQSGLAPSLFGSGLPSKSISPVVTCAFSR